MAIIAKLAWGIAHHVCVCAYVCERVVDACVCMSVCVWLCVCIVYCDCPLPPLPLSPSLPLSFAILFLSFLPSVSVLPFSPSPPLSICVWACTLWAASQDDGAVPPALGTSHCWRLRPWEALAAISQGSPIHPDGVQVTFGKRIDRNISLLKH